MRFVPLSIIIQAWLDHVTPEILTATTYGIGLIAVHQVEEKEYLH